VFTPPDTPQTSSLLHDAAGNFITAKTWEIYSPVSPTLAVTSAEITGVEVTIEITGPTGVTWKELSKTAVGVEGFTIGGTNSAKVTHITASGTTLTLTTEALEADDTFTVAALQSTLNGAENAPGIITVGPVAPTIDWKTAPDLGSATFEIGSAEPALTWGTDTPDVAAAFTVTLSSTNEALAALQVQSAAYTHEGAFVTFTLNRVLATGDTVTVQAKGTAYGTVKTPSNILRESFDPETVAEWFKGTVNALTGAGSASRSGTTVALSGNKTAGSALEVPEGVDFVVASGILNLSATTLSGSGTVKTTNDGTLSGAEATGVSVAAATAANTVQTDLGKLDTDYAEVAGTGTVTPTDSGDSVYSLTESSTLSGTAEPILVTAATGGLTTGLTFEIEAGNLRIADSNYTGGGTTGTVVYGFGPLTITNGSVSAEVTPGEVTVTLDQN